MVTLAKHYLLTVHKHHSALNVIHSRYVYQGKMVSPETTLSPKFKGEVRRKQKEIWIKNFKTAEIEEK